MIRQPIISVLGHVDHGKTTLLDKVRESAVAAKEAGGITQHIGATEVPIDVIKGLCGKLLEGRKITIPGLLFIDTPGHEAFTTLRRRGGSIADLAVLVVDIRQGFQPQTDESLTFLKEFKCPFIMAATKIDTISGWREEEGECFLKSYRNQNTDVKRELDNSIYQLMGDLSERGFNSERYDRVEDFKTTIAIVPVSGITGEGIPDLLTTLVGLSQQFLSHKLEVKEEIGMGNVLEVKDLKGLGTTIDVILYDGKIKKGDHLVIGGKEPVVTTIKALLKPRELGEIRVEKKFVNFEEVSAAAGIKIAAPGLENVIAGSPFRAVRHKKDVPKAKEQLKKEVEEVEIETKGEGVIIKADTLGSLEAMIKILKDKKIPIRKAKIGNVTRSEVMEEKSVTDPMKKVIFAFNVSVLPEAREVIEDVKIFENNIIYKLIEDFEEWKKEKEKEMEMEKLEELIRPGKIRLLPGYVFRQRKPVVVGVEVLKGIIKPGCSLVKEGKIIGKIEQIQKEGENVKEAKKGEKVAVSIEGPTLGRQIQEGDELYVALSKEMIKKLEDNKNLLGGDELELIEEIKSMVKK